MSDSRTAPGMPTGPSSASLQSVETKIKRPSLAFDDELAPLYTVGQVADMLGVRPAMLRRLDAEEVVQPARSSGGQRRYTRQEVLMVEEVVGLAGEGMTLAGIRRLLTLEATVRDLRRQISEMETRELDRRDASSRP